MFLFVFSYVIFQNKRPARTSSGKSSTLQFFYNLFPLKAALMKRFYQIIFFGGPTVLKSFIIAVEHTSVSHLLLRGYKKAPFYYLGATYGGIKRHHFLEFFWHDRLEMREVLPFFDEKWLFSKNMYVNDYWKWNFTQKTTKCVDFLKLFVFFTNIFQAGIYIALFLYFLSFCCQFLRCCWYFKFRLMQLVFCRFLIILNGF